MIWFVYLFIYLLFFLNGVWQYSCDERGSFEGFMDSPSLSPPFPLPPPPISRYFGVSLQILSRLFHRSPPTLRIGDILVVLPRLIRHDLRCWKHSWWILGGFLVDFYLIIGGFLMDSWWILDGFFDFSCHSKNPRCGILWARATFKWHSLFLK